jgi:predicted metal-dependent hydrolase
MPVRAIDDFVQQHSAWIQEKLERSKARSEQRQNAALSSEQISRLKRDAEAYLPQRTLFFAHVMGVRPTDIKITSARTRWGSCSYRDGICYSYRVMLLPSDLIDYVIVHELAHIKHKDHSPRFYAEVERYIPDRRERERRLKEI